MRFLAMQDSSDSKFVMGMFRVFGIDDQAFQSFDSEKVKSDLWNRFMLQIAMGHFLEHPVKNMDPRLKILDHKFHL